MSELLELSALELVQEFRARRVSPVEALAAVEKRADETRETVNAVAEPLHELALESAREAEKRYAGRGGGDPRPLEGIPIAAKEEHPVAGHALRLGSLVTSNEPAESNHLVVDRVLAAGGVLHARTTTPEFCCAGVTHSKLWGVTRNPWNLDYGPGGSSGGSGAALASGETFLATGSDIGGSIRMPASLCGVVGFKPPHGRVPASAPFNLDPYCTDGALARTVADTALLHNVLSGQHPSDPSSLADKVWIPEDLSGWRGKRVAYSAAVSDFPTDPDVQANTHRFAEALREAGCDVHEISVGVRKQDVWDAALAHYGLMLGPSVTEEFEDDGSFMPYVYAILDRIEEATSRLSHYEGLKLESSIQATIAGIFRDYDAFVCPTLTSSGWIADENEERLVVDGVELEYHLEGSMTPLFNVANRHPVLAVPSGIASNGVPTGVQVVGRPYDDVTPFIIGAAAESVLGWWNDQAWRPNAWHNATV